jgi:hypothetical protein
MTITIVTLTYTSAGKGKGKRGDGKGGRKPILTGSDALPGLGTENSDSVSVWPNDEEEEVMPAKKT